jgi:NADPH:quinone reductase-like Zn-dependent oxidoreductase
MKALVYRHYGSTDVLHLQEVDRPVPGPGEVLVRVHATTVNRTDNATVKGIPFFARLITGLFRPKQPIPGSEFAGEVEAVGEGVSSPLVGDRVFGFKDIGCGAQAEYLAVAADHVATIPDELSWGQAAAGTEGAHYARNFMNKVPIAPGQDVLVYGASGAIGSALVQLLKAEGLNVTAVCGARNVERVKSLGADRVIDYTHEDFRQDTQRYDYVFDAVGKVSFFKTRHLLKPGGVYISSDLGFLAQNIYLPMITPWSRRLLGTRMTAFPVPTDIPASLALVKRLIEEGKFRAVIDREYPFDQIVDAYRYVEQGHKTGNVVVTVA